MLHGQALLVYANRRQPGEEKTLHAHPEGQIWAVRQGLVTAQLGRDSWVLPPGHIGWIPPGTLHTATVHRAASGWTAYLRQDLCRGLPARPAAFVMTPLADALLDRIAGWGTAVPELGKPQKRLLGVLIDELIASPVESLYLSMPKHARLLKMAQTIAAAPDDKRTLAQWAAQIGMSERGLTRHFSAETGMSLVQWRSIARMKRALELLSDGNSVTNTAIELGYDSISTFIALFRRTFGVTPSRHASA